MTPERRYAHAWMLRFLWMLRDRRPEHDPQMNATIRYHARALRESR